MRLELISPTWQKAGHRKMKGKAFRVPQVALPIIAALTPRDIEISITDENVENIDFEKKLDLVGITTMTATAPRAYAIADQFRKRGVKVVIGGMHATALPQEVLGHADSVVVGEAEGSWQRLIEDLRRGKPEKLYSSPERHDLTNLPLPRRDLLRKKAYLVQNTLQTTRGCPFDCSFCSVSSFFGKTYRMRPVPEVIEEIRALKPKLVVFVDDNIVGNLPYAKKLFQALIAERIGWIGQASLNIVKDEELLKLAKKSGCRALFIGFETLSPSNLAEVGKKVNVVSRYKEAIKKLHDHGIGIEGAFIFGFDNDDKSVFERTVEFANRTKIELVQFGILTPFPGTFLYKKLESEGRIIERDWSKYDIETEVTTCEKRAAPSDHIKNIRSILINSRLEIIFRI